MLALILGIPIFGMGLIYVISTPLVWQHRADTVRACWFKIATIKNPQKRKRAFEQWMKENATELLIEQTDSLYVLLMHLPLELLDPTNPVKQAKFEWSKSTRFPSHTVVIMGEEVEGKQHRHHYHIDFQFDADKVFGLRETDLKLAGINVKFANDAPKHIKGPTFEALLWLTALLRLDDEEHLKEAFAALDIDGDGYITAKDLRARYEKVDPETLELLISRADTDHDGKISFQEFKNSLQEELAAD